MAKAFAQNQYFDGTLLSIKQTHSWAFVPTEIAILWGNKWKYKIWVKKGGTCSSSMRLAFAARQS